MRDGCKSWCKIGAYNMLNKIQSDFKWAKFILISVFIWKDDVSFYSFLVAFCIVLSNS